MPSSLQFGTNFKMNQTPAESRQFVIELRTALIEAFGVDDSGRVQVPARLVLLPPFTSLPGLATLTHEAGALLGAQNMHWADHGAYTGEISAQMLRAVDVDLVLLGHAERRRYFNETDHDLQLKIQRALDNELRVLFAFGETADEKAAGATETVLARQLKTALHTVPLERLERLMIVYEPVWAIGEGSTAAEPDVITTVATTIRTLLDDLFGEAGVSVPLLYGGSVTPKNCGDYVRLPQIDGLFVGRAAWTVPGFVNVLRSALAARRGGVSRSG